MVYLSQKVATAGGPTEMRAAGCVGQPQAETAASRDGPRLPLRRQRAAIAQTTEIRPTWTARGSAAAPRGGVAVHSAALPRPPPLPPPPPVSSAERGPVRCREFGPVRSSARGCVAPGCAFGPGCTGPHMRAAGQVGPGPGPANGTGRALPTGQSAAKPMMTMPESMGAIGRALRTWARLGLGGSAAGQGPANPTCLPALGPWFRLR